MSIKKRYILHHISQYTCNDDTSVTHSEPGLGILWSHLNTLHQYALWSKDSTPNRVLRRVMCTRHNSLHFWLGLFQRDNPCHSLIVPGYLETQFPYFTGLVITTSRGLERNGELLLCKKVRKNFRPWTLQTCCYFCRKN